MDRLLNEEQIKQIRLLPENENNTYSEMMTTIAKAQISKTDKEWVEWIADEIIEFALNFNRSAAFHETLLRVWGNRKKEIGL